MKFYYLGLLIGVLFSAIGTASLFIGADALTSAIWLSFGNGLLLSGYRFKRVDDQGNTYLMPVPNARLYAGLFLIMLAVLLLLFQMYLDLQVGK